MSVADFTIFEWLMLAEHELLVFAGVFFLIGALDEICVDFVWIWLRLTGRAKAQTLGPEPSRGQIANAPAAFGVHLAGDAAIFVPAWQEAGVIGTTISHMLSHWPHSRLRLYVGCYRNDPATINAAIRAANGDSRFRLVIHEREGPTTKADCLNRLYAALEEDERRSGSAVRMVVMHDAEDMVDPAGLTLLDAAMETAVLAQLPVLPVPQADSRWIGSHYCEEFAEAHGKAMVVRDALRVSMPLAGVGCAIRRGALAELASRRVGGSPFAADCLTEDYELGIRISAMGGNTAFLRYRHQDGRLAATRACFPARLDFAVRQKSRWVHGIAFQGWDRLGWTRRPAEIWMRLRDRRGPFAAFILAIGYSLLVVASLSWGMHLAGFGVPRDISPELRAVLVVNFVCFAWRALWRFSFTAHEYGAAEGFRAVLRIPVANVIAIMAGRRAFAGYVRSLAGQLPVWDKTHHHAHPALAAAELRKFTA